MPRALVFHLCNSNGDWAGVLIWNGAEENLAINYEALACIVVLGSIAWKDEDDEDLTWRNGPRLILSSHSPSIDFIMSFSLNE